MKNARFEISFCANCPRFPFGRPQSKQTFYSFSYSEGGAERGGPILFKNPILRNFTFEIGYNGAACKNKTRYKKSNVKARNKMILLILGALFRNEHNFRKSEFAMPNLNW